MKTLSFLCSKVPLNSNIYDFAELGCSRVSGVSLARTQGFWNRGHVETWCPFRKC